MTITGTLPAFENVTYTVRSPAGQVRFHADPVECQGAECPKGDGMASNAAPTDCTK